MSGDEALTNRVQSQRRQRGWSQAELARRSGVPRPTVSAIEGHRLVPSVAAALLLARAFGCAVEDLFGERTEPAWQWAWEPPAVPARFWRARVGDRLLLYPAELTAAGVLPHDGTWDGAAPALTSDADPEMTLVLAGCDPASGLLATLYARRTPFRLLPLTRPSRQSLDLLARGLVHAAGLHLSGPAGSDGNAAAARSVLGEGYRLLHLADWEEGLTCAPAAGVRSVGEALASRLTWVGREPGSGARECLDELLAGRRPPHRLAHDHRGVAEAVRCGWADIGVCLRLASVEAGQHFLAVRTEGYDLCFAACAEGDPRVRALLDVVRSPEYRRLLGELPGYDSRGTGEVREVE